MQSDLQTKLDAVCDEQTFIAFVAALAADREDELAKEKASPSSPYGPGANGWENGTIEAFLDASAAWATASENGLEFYRKPDNPWKRCADIIYMGKIYGTSLNWVGKSASRGFEDQGTTVPRTPPLGGTEGERRG